MPHCFQQEPHQSHHCIFQICDRIHSTGLLISCYRDIGAAAGDAYSSIVAQITTCVMVHLYVKNIHDVWYINPRLLIDYIHLHFLFMKASKHFTYRHFIAVISVVLTGVAIQVFSQGPFKIPEAPIQLDYVHDDYAHVIDLFKDNLKGGHDIGSGVAAYVGGELVLDIQGGWQDVESRVPYTKDTLNMVYSSTKMLVMRIYIWLSHIH